MGENFGKYELVRRLATGGMAEVFLAEQRGEMGGFVKKVAIKRMFPHMADSVEATNMFLDEARIAASFTHPNIVQIFELGREGDNLYLAMEYVIGRDLRRILDRGKELELPLPIHMAAHIVSQVAAGLHYAHVKTDDSGKPMNVIHRDISPQNVLVSDQGHVKVCDFGIARAEDRLQHTKEGQFKGKVSYMSPEQFETSVLDHRTDIYAMGVLLYEASTGTRLYDADTDLDILRLMAIGEIRLPTDVVTGYPAELEGIVLKCIAKDPNDRFASAEELHLAIDAWLEGSASRPSALHLGRYLKTLFPELSEPASGESHTEHMEKTTVAPASITAEVPAATTAEVPYAADFSKIAADDEATVVVPPSNQASEWDDEGEEDKTVLIAEGYDQTAEMNAFQREKLKEASDPVSPRVDLPEFGTTSSATATAAPAVVEPPVHAPAPAPVPTPAPAPALNLAVPRIGAVPVGPPAASAAPPAAPPAASAPQVPPAGMAPPAVARPAAAAPRPAPGFAPPPAARTAPPNTQSPVQESQFDDADVSLEGFVPARKKSAFLIPIAFAVGLVVASLVFYIQLNQESDLEKAAIATNIDEKLLEDEAVPVPPTVEVAFQSEPPGASFVVNGLPAIAGAGDKLVLREGVNNQVTAMLEGFEFESMVVDGKASSNPFIIKLERRVPEGKASKRAALAVVSEPRDATVWLDGREVGRTPLTLNDLSADVEHYVYMTKDDHFSYAGFIGLVPGSENEVQVELQRRESARRNYVEVIYAAIPRMTTVTLDGEPTGVTPMRKNHERLGVVEVAFDEADHAPQSYVLQMEEVGTFELRPYLREMKREKGTVSLRVEPAGATLYVGPNGYGADPVSKLELKEGRYPVVVENLGERFKGTIDVAPKAHTNYVLSIQDGKVRAEKQP